MQSSPRPSKNKSISRAFRQERSRTFKLKKKMYSCNINKFKRVRDFAETYIANSYSGDRVEKG